MVAGDLECINQPLDFFGTNIYSGIQVRANANGSHESIDNKDLPVTAMGWPVTPQALYWGPKYFYQRYRLPIVITESGMANSDSVHNGRVDDHQRIDFLQSYLGEYARVIEEGVPARAYFLWSLLDNFEWAEGYDKRFGIVYVDYTSQQRIMKDSAYWYRDFIASQTSGGEPVSAKADRRSETAESV